MCVKCVGFKLSWWSQWTEHKRKKIKNKKTKVCEVITLKVHCSEMTLDVLIGHTGNMDWTPGKRWIPVSPNTALLPSQKQTVSRFLPQTSLEMTKEILISSAGHLDPSHVTRLSLDRHIVRRPQGPQPTAGRAAVQDVIPSCVSGSELSFDFAKRRQVTSATGNFQIMGN